MTAISQLSEELQNDIDRFGDDWVDAWQKRQRLEAVQTRRRQQRRLLTIALLLACISVLLLFAWTQLAYGMPIGPGAVEPPQVEIVHEVPSTCQVMGILREPVEMSSARQAYMYHIFCFAQ